MRRQRHLCGVPVWRARADGRRIFGRAGSRDSRNKQRTRNGAPDFAGRGINRFKHNPACGGGEQYRRPDNARGVLHRRGALYECEHIAAATELFCEPTNRSRALQKMKTITLCFLLVCGSAFAAQPQLKPLRASWGEYVPPPGASNVVIVVYKSTSLGTVWTPFKPAAVVPATRTNVNFSVLAGTYRFYATVQAQPFGESDPSNVVTNRVNP